MTRLPLNLRSLRHFTIHPDFTNTIKWRWWWWTGKWDSPGLRVPAAGSQWGHHTPAAPPLGAEPAEHGLIALGARTGRLCAWEGLPHPGASAEAHRGPQHQSGWGGNTAAIYPGISGGLQRPSYNLIASIMTLLSKVNEIPDTGKTNLTLTKVWKLVGWFQNHTC